jgi:ubiquinol-cytochrome c reductase cytochrome b subunit
MMRAFLAWLDDRTGCNDLVKEALYERIPGGARWRYVWGSTLIFTFSVQVITGIFLWAAYSPSAQTAWESVYFIQEKMFLGWLVRGIHHFTAQAMIVLLAIHLIQVIIDGAYKAPREVNFWLGLILMKIILALGLTGYLLPWDQKGYYATKVTTNIMSVTPVVGEQVQQLAVGGKEYGHHTLTRFFAMHAGILPGLLIGFLVLHIYVFRRHGIHAKAPKAAPEASFWPDQVLKDGVACLGVLAVILLLAIFKGAELNPPANPAESFEAARPEWYFLFLFRFIKIKLIGAMGTAFGALYIPGLLFGILVAMPLIAKWKSGHKFNVAYMWVIMSGIVLLTGLAFYEDGTNEDHQAALAEVHRDGARVKELANGPMMIPVEGAGSLLASDPFTRGPRIFADKCTACHRWNGHNGRGRLLKLVDKSGGSQITMPVATDLANANSREWLRSVIVDYSNHFGHLTQSQWYKAAAEGGEDEYIDPIDGEMATASADYKELFAKADNKQDLDALVEYLHSLSGRNSDKALVARGEAILKGEALASGDQMSSCLDCHDTIGSDYSSPEEAPYYPDLAEYMSKKWLKAFIRDPSKFYGDKNQMPAYNHDALNDRDLDLLVRWMTRDYETEVHDYPSRLADVPKPPEVPTAADEGESTAVE